MCGIGGVFSVSGKPVIRENLVVANKTLSHRGPDGEGYWFNEEKSIGLAHRRLAIIDLSEKGAQPMSYLDRYVITLNGEIYNYLELREMLSLLGCSFTSNSDTEVLLALYHTYGEKCLNYIDGMFAFALYDQQEKTLFCARDRFGEKPFFYAYQKNVQFVFGSEIKFIHSYSGEVKYNEEMIFLYLTYQLCENPLKPADTFFKGVYKLPAGHCLTIKSGQEHEIKGYYKLEEPLVPDEYDLGEAIVQFRHLFNQSVSRRLRSDVKVGTSLSGGLDSSAIVASISEQPTPETFSHNAFSARFDDSDKDEGPYIHKMVESFQLNGFETWVNEENFLNNWQKITWHHEEPVASASVVAQWEVMKLAALNQTKVLIDGQGADEVLAGYLHFYRTYLRELFVSDMRTFLKERNGLKELHGVNFINPRFIADTLARPVLKKIGEIRRSQSIPSYLEDLHPEFLKRQQILPSPFKIFNRLNDALLYSTTVYGLGKLLKFADRNSMAFGVEIRLPFLNHQLVEFLFSLPANFKLNKGWTKFILRKSYESVLPDEITWRKKKLGFEPPQEKWLQHPALVKLSQDAINFLISNKIIEKPLRDKTWVYLSLYMFMLIYPQSKS